MTQVAFPGVGLEFPVNLGNNEVGTILSTAFTLNSTGAQTSIIGQLFINGSPASSTVKTMSTAGSISIRLGAVTFNSSTIVRAGIQTLSTANGPAVHPSGTSDVFGDLNTTATINANSTRIFPMTGGGMNLVHGQEIAIAFQMQRKASTSSIVVQGMAMYTALMHRPVSRSRPVSTVTWNVPSVNLPMAHMTFDDGTKAFIANAYPAAAVSTEIWTTTTNPNERGMLFQVPQDVKINGLWMANLVTASTTLFDFTLYSDPLGTPAVMLTNQFLRAIGPPGVVRKMMYGPVDMVSLSKNTNYVVAVKAQSTTNFELDSITLADISTNVFFGSSTLVKVTRNGATAFAVDPTSTHIFRMGVNIVSWDDGTGTGGAGAAGMLYIPNMSGT